MNKKSFTVTLLLISAFSLFAADNLPSGYRKLRFGMSVDEAKKTLKADPDFGYRGDRDVSLLPGENRTLIETDTSKTAPYSFMDRCFLQFDNDRLFIINVQLKQDKTDHYSVYTSLTEKYGQPDSLSPDKSEWRSEGTIITLERPLTLKYFDRKIFEQLQSESMVNKTQEERRHSEFLKTL